MTLRDTVWADSGPRFCPWCGIQPDRMPHRPGCIHDQRLLPEDYIQPLYCQWCGARLQGGATDHGPDCEITALLRYSRNCSCRTCGHRAAAHSADGDCFDCGRARCWS